MADVELILLQRVEKLGQMGELVKVKPGFARNFLLPQKKALRASKENLARFEQQRVQLEAQNLKRREEAERVAERVSGLSVVIIRQAGESGSLYGSVSARDIAEATHRGRTDRDALAGRAGASDQDAWTGPGARRVAPRGLDPRSPSTSRAARKRPSGRHAASGSVRKRSRRRTMPWMPPPCSMPGRRRRSSRSPDGVGPHHGRLPRWT